MFFVLVFAAAFASPYGPSYDEVLVDHPVAFQLPEEVAAEPVWDACGYPLVASPLHGDGVIDLVEPPPLMPTRAAAPVAPALRAASSVAAVTVEARTRE